ncbi:RBBP9/YdeN family alpha/beta hydrolase [Acetobacter cibinongensis]|uniref:RBBP9/YdeN family alpha/beta hydrolase n=1 Tax=Acetobacter cibinongensis TaxID=146475 RepID=UPI001055EB7D|nr:alpha/beta hydrolase [Acetobacter cibinongensis]
MRHNVIKRTSEARYARTTHSTGKNKVASQFAFLRQNSAKQRASSPQTNIECDDDMSADIVRHLSTSLAAFELVIVPGLDGSARHHWQSCWQTLFYAGDISFSTVNQKIWSKPHYKSWILTLVSTVKKSRKPVLLIGHSLGCLLIAHAVEQGVLPNTVVGALLVAPADVENGPEQDRSRVAAFSPVPLSPLPFPTLVVGSRNDPWLSVTRARMLARHWNASFIDAGLKGHIGNQSHVGYWLDGLMFLDRLAQTALIEKTGLRRFHKRILQ